MTGGVVVMLGTVGRNVGAGMTGGLGYFYDQDGNFEKRVNREIVKVQKIVTPEGEAQLKTMIERHYELTGSERADDILSNWEEEKNKFFQIYPPSEAKNPAVREDVEIIANALRISARAPTGEVCFLPAGARMTPEQTQRCAD
jgi:glutamate synthase (ferredoxin)